MGPRIESPKRHKRVVGRRVTAVLAAAGLASGAALLGTAEPAGAAPIGSAVFSGNATSSIVALNNVTLGTTNLVDAQVAQSVATVGGPPAGSAATSTNLHADLAGRTLLNVPTPDSLSVTAPPPASASRTLLSIPASPLVNAGVLSGAVTATWPTAAGTCPAANQPTSTARTSTAGVTVLGLSGRVPTAPDVLSTSDATATGATQLVSVGGVNRGVQASATNTVSHIDLFGGSAKGGVTITVNQAPVLTGVATGVAGTSGVTFTPATGTVTIGASGTPQALTPHLSIPLNLNLGVIVVSGSLTLNGNPTNVTNTGTSVTGDAALLSVALNVSTPPVAQVPGVQITDVNLAVAPLHVAATAPASGIQCGATATSLNPDHGPTTGGTTVTVTGTCFVAGQTSVTIGGITIPASAVTVVNATTLTFVTPPHAAGPVHVTVATPCGVTPPLTYTYIPVPPVITQPGDGSHTGDSTPPIAGTGTPGDTVTVSEGGTTVCTALVDTNGNWACNSENAFSCAAHTITAVQSVNGETSAPSQPVTFTLDCPGLAATGTSGTVIGAYAGALLIGGAFIFAAGRRRRNALN